MVDVNKAFTVRYKKDNKELEILVDFDLLEDFKKDPNNKNIYDILADYKIYKDQKKGEIAPETFLKELFNNKDEETILKEIAINGECQIPTAYLNKLREEKKMQVINYISENSVNPANKSKYTRSMIEGEINKLKYNFNGNRDHVKQAEEVTQLLKKIMPISIEKIVIEINVPGMYCGAFYGPFRKYGNITKEYFDKDGNLRMHMETTHGLVDDVINYIKNKSNNEAEYFIRND